MLLRRMAMIFGLMSLASAPGFAVEFQPIKQQAMTAHYRLELMIGPMEKVMTAAQAASANAKEGEVMIRGTMATPKDMANARHLELHVYALDKGTAVSDANVTIIVTDSARKIVTLPIAVMYGVADGPSDTHYGNLIGMPAGSYTIDVTANGEKSSFKVMVP